MLYNIIPCNLCVVRILTQLKIAPGMAVVYVNKQNIVLQQFKENKKKIYLCALVRLVACRLYAKIANEIVGLASDVCAVVGWYGIYFLNLIHNLCK